MILYWHFLLLFPFVLKAGNLFSTFFKTQWILLVLLSHPNDMKLWSGHGIDVQFLSKAFLFLSFSSFVISSSLPKRKRLNFIAVPRFQHHHSVLLCTLAPQLEGCHLDCWLGVSGWLYDGLPVCPRLTLPLIKAFSKNNLLKSWFTENKMESHKKVKCPV